MGKQGAGQHVQAQAQAQARYGAKGTVFQPAPPKDRPPKVVVAIFRRDEGLIAVAAVWMWSRRRYRVHGPQPTVDQMLCGHADCGLGS